MAGHRVLVTAVGGNIGQGIVKSLRNGKRSYFIVGIDMTPLSAGFSFVDSYHVVPKTGSIGFKDRIKGIASEEGIEAIYVCSPTELQFFSEHKEEFEKEIGLSVFVNPPEVVRIGSDKLMTAEFLRKNSLPYPETVSANDEEGISEIIERNGFPLFVKPREGCSSKNVSLVNSREEINAARILVPNLIVQMYLPNVDSEYTATTVSDSDQKVRASIVLHRDLIQGTTYRTELIRDIDITDQVIRIVESLRAVGSCNLQFRLIDGKVFVFEINPRFSGTSGVRYLYGFNDAEMVFEHFRLGIDMTQPELHQAVILRYWNEVYIPGADFRTLRENSKIHYGIQTIVNKPPHQDKSAIDETSERSLDMMADKYYTEKAFGPGRKQMSFIMDAVLKHCNGPKVLELGYGSGHWTQRLVDMGLKVTVVEGSSILTRHCSDRFGGKVNVVCSLFEKYRPQELYDTIIALCVLEHVKDCNAFLALLKLWLADNGNLHIIVPNALSLHRRIGLKMGLLDHPLELSPQEHEVGHLHSFTQDSFKQELERAGLKIDFLKGVFIKPLSSSQMIGWPESLLEAYNDLSDELPEYTAFLYAHCSKH